MNRLAGEAELGPLRSDRGAPRLAGPPYHYLAFGHCIESQIELPELERIDPCPPRWAFRLMREEEASSGGRLLGEERLYGDVSARLYHHADGYRVEVDDTGLYDLTSDGSRIGWLPNAEPWWDFGRGHLLGRVLATAMHFSGLIVLHGSAVEIDGGVIMLLGAKGAGKSTLALALVGAGARLVTDDTVPIEVGTGSTVWPGIHSLRLRPDMLHSGLVAETAGLGAVERDGKARTAPLDRSMILQAPAPLRAVYLLQPAMSSSPTRALERFEIDPVRATASITGFAKVGGMLGPSEAETLLDQAAAVGTAVPVYLLAVHRAVDRLDQVAKEILAWHRRAPRDR